MEIEIGDYVRTKLGIAKVESMVCGEGLYFDNDNIFDEDEKRMFYYDAPNKDGQWAKKNIIRVQKRPIDLIMEGDYVNGGLVEQVNDDYIIVALPDYEEWQTITNDAIKTIVTKEQFERMMYNVR